MFRAKYKIIDINSYLLKIIENFTLRTLSFIKLLQI